MESSRLHCGLWSLCDPIYPPLITFLNFGNFEKKKVSLVSFYFILYSNITGVWNVILKGCNENTAATQWKILTWPYFHGVPAFLKIYLFIFLSQSTGRMKVMQLKSYECIKSQTELCFSFVFGQGLQD